VLRVHVTFYWAEGCDSCIFAAVLYLFLFPNMRIQELQLFELNNLGQVVVVTPEPSITPNRESPNFRIPAKLSR
jgi:hypothetical protein